MPNAQLFDRLVVGCDVQGFSARNVRQQRLIQAELDRMLTDAASAAGLDRGTWDHRGDGDGEVAVLPADVNLLAVVRRFVTELDRLLTDHNEDHAQEARIRLRIAMASGSVVPGGPMGHGGQALIDLARLLNAPPLRQALTDVPKANLAQVLSESLFQRAVPPELDGIRPDQFRHVIVNIPEKGFYQDAYIYVPGGWPEPAPDPDPPVPDPPARASVVDHDGGNGSSGSRGPAKFSGEEVTALAEIFPPSRALGLLREATYPMAEIPAVPGTAAEFWEQICQSIEQGVLPGGRRLLMKAAARRFPANPVFRSALNGDGDPGSPGTARDR